MLEIEIVSASMPSRTRTLKKPVSSEGREGDSDVMPGSGGCPRRLDIVALVKEALRHYLVGAGDYIVSPDALRPTLGQIEIGSIASI